MKKFCFLFLQTALWLGCSATHEQFVVHETTPLYAEPDETSQVVGEQKYSDREPVVAEQVKGDFALVKRIKQDEVEVEYWLPLSDINAVAPAGTTDKDEESDLLVVVPKKLTFYARPEVNKKKEIFRLAKGDSVRAVGRHEGWVHAEVVQYSHTGKGKKEKDERIAVYGWVEETPENLEAVGQVTQHAYDRRALAKVNPSKAKRLTYLEDMSSGKGLLNHRGMRNVWSFCHKLFIVSAILALIWNILVLFKITERAQCDRVLLPFCLILLTASIFVKYPHWYMAAVLPFACMMVLYPLLLTNAAKAFKTTYFIAIGGFLLVYMIAEFSANNYSGLDWLWHAFCFFIWYFALYALWGGLGERCHDYVCPHCAFYGLHYHEGTDEETSKPFQEYDGYTDEYSHSETRGNVKTNYYNRVHHYSWKRTITTRAHYTCYRCRQRFTVTSRRNVSA